MPVVDSAMTRDVLRDIAKHPIDISSLHVHVQSGVVYLAGRIERLRGYYEDLDLEQELMRITRMLRQKPGVRDVCCEVDFGQESLKQRMSPHTRRPFY